MNKPVAAATTSPRLMLHLEDSEDFAALIGELLKGFGWDVRWASTLEDAKGMLGDNSFACALVDLGLPDVGGFEAIMTLRALAPHTPLVVLSGDENLSAAVKAVLLGAQDWVAKADVSAERLATVAELAITRHDAQAQLAWRASHDELTSLPNRPLALEHLTRALGRATRRASKVGVLFCDLDDFKSVNDRFGHEAGDEMLAVMARRLIAAVRPGDTVARWGGDEFVVIADELALVSDAVILADRLQAAVAAPVSVVAGTSEQRTMTIGVAISGPTTDANSLVNSADHAMLEAKRREIGVLVAERRFAPAPDADLGRSQRS